MAPWHQDEHGDERLREQAFGRRNRLTRSSGAASGRTKTMQKTLAQASSTSR